MDLLIFLVQRRGQLVSRDEIAECLWGRDVFLDVDHSINVAVRKVRTVLRDDPDQPRFIETVVGRGYRFAATVTTDDGTSNPQLESTASSPQAVSEPAPSPPLKAARTVSFRLKVLLGVCRSGRTRRPRLVVEPSRTELGQRTPQSNPWRYCL